MDFPQDVGSGASTTAGISIGDLVTSQLESGTDTDWFQIELVQGDRYQFDLSGAGLSQGLTDPLLRLHQNGQLLAQDDNDGPGLDPRIIFTAPATGTYYLEAASPAAQSGEYVLTTVNLSNPSADGSNTSLTRAIDWGTGVGTNSIDVYFAEQGETFAGHTSFGWTDEEIEQVQAAMAEYEAVTDLTFNRVFAPDEAEFKLVVSAPIFFAGSMFAPGETNEGVGIFSRAALHDGGGLVKGGNGFQIVLHELAHGFGLAHPHDTGGSSVKMNGVGLSFGDYGDFDLNQGVFTTLSYNSGYRSETGREPAKDYGVSGTLSPLDIAVLQSRYGANDDANSGATTYELPSTNGIGTYYAALWDTGGTDRLVHSGSADATLDLRAATLEYEHGGGGFVSRVDGIFGGFTIANGTVIEEALGGSGNDTINGNEAANTLRGGDGDDDLSGFDGNDRIFGGIGADILTGGLGIDTLRGDEGADTFVFGAEDEGAKIIDFDEFDTLQFATSGAARLAFESAQQSGDDTILSFNDTEITLRDIDSNSLGRSGKYISIEGNKGDDTYTYSINDGSFAITARQETATSGEHDRIVFTNIALSDVTFHFDEGALGITWQQGSEAGTVTIDQMGSHIESFEFADGSVLGSINADFISHRANNPIAGDERDTLNGTAGDDQIIGTAGTDWLNGRGGDDVLDAGGTAGGWQVLRGHRGDDTYSYRKESGRVLITSESETSGEADRLVFHDLALSDVTFATRSSSSTSLGDTLRILWNDGSGTGEVRIAQMGAHIESFEFADGSVLSSVDADFLARRSDNPLEGDERDILRGTDEADHILGTAGTDRIYGQSGDDVLDAGGTVGGWQFLRGHGGNDTYLYGKESGQVTVLSETADSGDEDRLIFKDLARADVVVSTHDYGNDTYGEALLISWDDGTDAGEIRLAHGGAYIERFEFADGSVFDHDDLM